MSYSSLPPIGDIGNLGISEVPSLEELGYKDDEQADWTPFRGGESEALKRLTKSISDKCRHGWQTLRNQRVIHLLS
jgi:cryptochrome